MSDVSAELGRFHLLGPTSDADPMATSGLIPALLAPYRDLAALRYDYPLILTDEPPYARCLSDVVNDVLRQLAPPGAAGERLRQHVLRLERELRRLLARGRRGALGELWDLAAKVLVAESDEAQADALEASFDEAKRVLEVDGRIVDCDGEVGSVVVEHVWQAVCRRSSRDMGRRIDELALGLSGILQADELRSGAGLSPEKLRASLGGDHRSSFDFESWSEIAGTSSTSPTLSDARRRRIREARAVLRAQRFFPLADDDDHAAPTTLDRFRFARCADAVEAFTERRRAMAEAIRAMAIAELELANRYREADHDPFFAQFDEGSLSPEDVALFPSYLVCLTDRDLDARETARLIDVLGSDAPIIVVVECRDALGGPPPMSGATPGLAGPQLARLAIGLGQAFVLQTASSNLPRMTERIGDGVAASGPALFSVFTGSTDDAPSLPPYLVAAAAMRSRCFPAFCYDPGAGPDWADRFDVELNPQPDAVWPTDVLVAADAELQRHAETVAFTPIDFAALDRRYARHFARVGDRSDDMAPADRQLEADGAAAPTVPYVLMAGDDGGLERVVVDRRLIRLARRVGEVWHSLRELGGIHNSHARALVATERATWEEQHTAEAVGDAGPVGDGPAGDAPTVEVSEPSADETPDERVTGEPFIETARCTTCDECTKLNAKMFAYDDNKQAYIKDASAGTFKELVMAAEKCPVRIIHPGKPLNPDEQGLEDLIKRAQPFQ